MTIKSITLMGQRWIVRRSALPRRDMGEIDQKTNTIIIDTEVEGDCYLDTLIHESLHAGEAMLMMDIEEEVMYRMAPVVLSLIRDNPGLVAAIQGSGCDGPEGTH